MKENSEPEPPPSNEKEVDHHDDERVITQLGNVEVTNAFIDELGRGKGK